MGFQSSRDWTGKGTTKVKLSSFASRENALKIGYGRRGCLVQGGDFGHRLLPVFAPASFLDPLMVECLFAFPNFGLELGHKQLKWIRNQPFNHPILFKTPATQFYQIYSASTPNSVGIKFLPPPRPPQENVVSFK